MEGFNSKLKGSGNIAGAYLDGDMSTMYYAHSRLSNNRNGYNGSSVLVIEAENRRFEYMDVIKSDGTIRYDTYNDTEAKLFEYFANVYEVHPFTSITMYSERGMCPSCQNVMRQFMKMFPGVDVNVVSNKSIEGNVWKWKIDAYREARK